MHVWFHVLASMSLPLLLRGDDIEIENKNLKTTTKHMELILKMKK